MAEEQKTTVELVTIKLEDGVITPLRETNGRINDIVNTFGQFYLRRKELQEEMDLLESNLEKSENDFKELNEEMRKMISALEKDYPRGQIDLAEGVLTYNPAFKAQQEAAASVQPTEAEVKE